MLNCLIMIKIQQKLTCPPGGGSNIEDVGIGISVAIVSIIVVSFYDYDFFNCRARIRSDRSACKNCRKLNI